MAVTTDRRARRLMEIHAGAVPIALWPALRDALVGAADELGIRLSLMPVGPADGPMVDLDAVEVFRLRARVAELEAQAAAEETALAFETTCTGCGQAWAIAYDERLRRDAAEARLARVWARLDDLPEIGGPPYAHPRFAAGWLAGRDMLAAMVRSALDADGTTVSQPPAH